MSISLRTLALRTTLAASLALAACAGDTASNDVVDASPETTASDTESVDSAAPDTMAPLDTGDDTAPDADPGDTSVADAPDAVETDTREPFGPTTDQDDDGVLDLAELDDGTDPFDPRSARAWHPEITGHPRLFLGPDDVASVAARKDLAGTPHAALWARITARAAATPPEQPTDGTYVPSTAVARGEIAENAAFVGLLTGDAAATQVAFDLLAAPFPDPSYLNVGTTFDVGAHYDLTESEALVAFCTAFDYVAGTPGVDPTALLAAEQRITQRIDYMRAICLGPGGCRTLIRNERNNHTMKVVGAVGLCAIAVPDRPTAAADFNEAVASLDWLLNVHQGVPEGGYGEGWNYLNYGSQSYLQLMAAMHRLAPGRTWLLRHNGLVLTQVPDQNKVVPHLDLVENLTSRGAFLGMLKATRPDGLTVPVDDANPSAMSAGFLAAMFDDPRFLWNWSKARVNNAASRCATGTFALLDPAMAATSPDWARDIFLPEAGFSVLRTTFDPDQLYVHVNHERGPVRNAGFSHEHADNLSVIVHAFGEPLIIDPGYIDYSHHQLVKYATDHNLVLVDGDGPPFFPLDPLVETQPNCDAFLHTFDADPALTTLIASTKYADAELARRVVRVDGRFVVLADRMTSAAPREYTWQLNGLAGGDTPNTTFTATDLGGVWARPNARAVVAVLPTVGAATFAQTLEDHQNDGGHKQHVRLTAAATMDTGAGFLTVILPERTDDPAATVVAVDPGAGVAGLEVTFGDGAVYVVGVNLSAASATVSGTASDLALLSGELGVWRASGGGEARTWPMATPEIPDPVPFIPEE